MWGHVIAITFGLFTVLGSFIAWTMMIHGNLLRSLDEPDDDSRQAYLADLRKDTFIDFYRPRLQWILGKLDRLFGRGPLGVFHWKGAIFCFQVATAYSMLFIVIVWIFSGQTITMDLLFKNIDTDIDRIRMLLIIMWIAVVASNYKKIDILLRNKIGSKVQSDVVYSLLVVGVVLVAFNFLNYLFIEFEEYSYVIVFLVVMIAIYSPILSITAAILSYMPGSGIIVLIFLVLFSVRFAVAYMLFLPILLFIVFYSGHITDVTPISILVLGRKLIKS